MKTRQIFFLTVILIFSVTGLFSQPVVSLAQFASGFIHPVDITSAGDERLFITEQAGKIWIVNSSGQVNPLPFLDITDRVKSGGEQGLLGLAFHPQYFSNGYIYMNYTGKGDSTHISRFTADPANPDLAIAASEFNLLTVYQPYTNHNGGCLRFGPDGYLYFGLGDGGAGGDPENRAQDSSLLLGKILRIDVSSGNPYAIPATNPFPSMAGVAPEIWALGLRNPWRFSFDRQTGDLWIGDVGESTYEEIDYQEAGLAGGRNYGWHCYEGNSPYDSLGCQPAGSMTFPVYTYGHLEGCAITGGYVYRGAQSPALYGKYLFADYCGDFIRALYDSLGTWVSRQVGHFPGNNLSSFGQDSAGELYIAGLTSGIIYKISGGYLGLDEIAARPGFSVYPNPSGGLLTLEIQEPLPENTILKIFDMPGREVFNTPIHCSSTTLDIRNLDPGIYILMLQNSGETRIERLVLEKN